MNQRKAILDAAIIEFSRQGYHKTSMDVIALSANVTKGALYYYFKNKADLFYEVIKGGLDLFGDELTALQSQDLSIEKLLRGIISAYLNICLDYPKLAMLILSENVNSLDAELSSRIRELLNLIYTQMSVMLRGGIEFGNVKQLNIETVSVAFLGMLNAISIRYLRQDGNPSREDIIDTLYEMVSSGILKRSN